MKVFVLFYASTRLLNTFLSFIDRRPSVFQTFSSTNSFRISRKAGAPVGLDTKWTFAVFRFLQLKTSE